MSSTDASTDTSPASPEAGTIDMKLEVVTLPVSDVDRANASTRASDGGSKSTSSSATHSGRSI
jgi:hypothetical protein